MNQQKVINKLILLIIILIVFIIIKPINSQYVGYENDLNEEDKFYKKTLQNTMMALKNIATRIQGDKKDEALKNLIESTDYWIKNYIHQKSETHLKQNVFVENNNINKNKNKNDQKSNTFQQMIGGGSMKSSINNLLNIKQRIQNMKSIHSMQNINKNSYSNNY